MTKPFKKKTHELRIVVRFDKSVRQTRAVLAARECLEGTYYPSEVLDNDPAVMKLIKVTKKS